MDINKVIDENLPEVIAGLETDIETMLNKVVEKSQLLAELYVIETIKNKFNPTLDTQLTKATFTGELEQR